MDYFWDAFDLDTFQNSFFFSRIKQKLKDTPKFIPPLSESESGEGETTWDPRKDISVPSRSVNRNPIKPVQIKEKMKNQILDF